MYDFSTLSFEDFERLAADLLSEEWGRRIESFKIGKDNGIDLRCSTVNSTNEKIIIQCKHYREGQFAKLLSKLENEELGKIKKLNPKQYILITSLPLSPYNKEQIIKILDPWLSSSEDIYGRDEINGLLRKHQKIEKNHFKLWISSTSVLERILNGRVFSVTEETLNGLKDEVSRLVIHPGFSEALTRLQEQHHVMIVGNPGIGKTTLARMLMCHYLEEGFEPVVIEHDIGDAWDLINKAVKSGEKLVIYYDDFLGQLAFGEKKFEKNEEKSLFLLFDIVKKKSNLRFILTTREYIYADAKRLHGAFNQRADEIKKFTLTIDHYSLEHRSKILFNHMYFSDIPEIRRKLFVESKVYRTIVKHQFFNPRTVENICKIANSKSMTDEEYIVFACSEFNDPSKVWGHAFEHEISHVSRNLLAALWSFGGEAELHSLMSTTRLMLGEVSPPQEFEHQFKIALRELSGNFTLSRTLIVLGKADEKAIMIRFQNPSVHECVQRFVLENSILFYVIINSLTEYSQVRHIYHWSQAQAPSESVPLRKLIEEPEFWKLLEKAAEKLHLFPEGGVGPYSQTGDQTYIKAKKFSFASRLMTWGQIASTMCGQSNLPDSILSHWSSRAAWSILIDTVRDDISEASAVSDLFCWVIKNEEAIAGAKLLIEQSFKEEVIQFLGEGEWLWLEGLSSFSDALRKVDSQYYLEIQNAITQSVEIQCDSLLGSDADLETFEQELVSLEEIADLWGIDCSDHISNLNGQIEHLRDEESFNEDEDYDKDHYSTEAQSDFDIDNLFGALLE